MAYTKTTWTNGSGEPISADNLNNIENGIESNDTGKVDNSRVLTDVPVDAVFTDTTYTDAEIKTKYEANANTEAYTTAEQAHVNGIEAGATANETNEILKARANHTGTQTADTISNFQAAVSTNTDVTQLRADVDSKLDDVVAGTNITIDKTDPDNPIINGSAGGSGGHDITQDGGVASTTRTKLNFIGATVGDNESNDSTDVTITGTGNGESNTASNSGAGEGLALPKNGVDLPFKTLVAGTNIGLSSDGSTITINNTDATHSVDSVNGEVGVVVLTTSDVGEGSNLYFTNPRVAANAAVSANTAERHSHANAVVLNNTTASYTTAEQTHVNSIEAGATANETNEILKARANHTGTQVASTISDFQEVVSENPDITQLQVDMNGKLDDVTAGTNITIDRTNPANPIINGSAGGSGGHDITQDGGVAVTTRTKLNFIGASVGDNPGNDSTDVTITGTGGGESNTSSNSGLGEGLALPKNGIDLPFKTIVAGTNISISSDASTVTITNTDSTHTVDSVNSKIGVVVLTTSDIGEGSNLYFTNTRVAANATVAANTAERHAHANGAILDNTTASYTTIEETKLAGIDTGATANDTDANLRDRATHTGTQLASTISDFQTEVSTNSDVTTNNAKVGVTNEEKNTINSAVVGEPTGSDVVLNMVSLTQAEYDAGTPVATTFYIING